MNQIEEFNRIRRIVFSTFHKGEQGQIDAFSYLEGFRKKLDPRSYVGLKAELGFYQKYRKEFSLSVSADVGDHTDFSGLMAKEAFRFDVTTNADYKKLKDYEPLQKDIEAKYKIAVVNHSGDIDELIDINFPFCPECEEGRLIDTVVLLPENYNDKGESKGTNDQTLIGVCNNCQYFEEQHRISTHFLFDFNTEINNALESERDEMEYLQSLGQNPVFDVGKIIQSHSNNVLPYLHKQFDKSIMALCDKSYTITDPRDGDGYNCLKVQWRRDLKLLDDYILDEYEIDID
jgi:hypothetical protein